MTGAEAAAAALVGKVVTNAGKEAAEASKSIKKELLEQATKTPEFELAAKNYAKRVALRQELLTSMYKPIAKMLGVANHYFENDFEEDMAEKLNDVPQEHLVAPKASIAAPAMQHLGFSLDEPDLKEMYLSLLVTASDDRKQNSAHPSFVEVIKQLSASEIPFLEEVMNSPGRSTPLVRFKLQTAGSEGYNIVMSHAVKVTAATGRAIREGTLPTYVDNWIRLGIVNVDYTELLADTEAYNWVETSGYYLGFKKHLVATPERTLTYDKGVLTVTDFGVAFAQAVGISEKAASK